VADERPATRDCWTLAENAGDRTPDRMRRLLERASWNTFTVRDFVVEHPADGGLTVLVLDEKTGTVANAVNFVNVTYGTPRGHALVGSRLYIPAEHLADEEVRAGMGTPRR
jgi:hypothetical protein